MTWLDTVGRITGIALIVLTAAAVLAGLVALAVRGQKRRRARRANFEEIMRIAHDIRRRMAESADDTPDDDQ